MQCDHRQEISKPRHILLLSVRCHCTTINAALIQLDCINHSTLALSLIQHCMPVGREQHVRQKEVSGGASCSHDRMTPEMRPALHVATGQLPSCLKCRTRSLNTVRTVRYKELSSGHFHA